MDRLTDNEHVEVRRDNASDYVRTDNINAREDTMVLFCAMYDRLAAYEDLGTPEQLAARVEVVRCESCKHRFESDWCSVVGDTRRDGEFCSYGEWREG